MKNDDVVTGVVPERYLRAAPGCSEPLLPNRCATSKLLQLAFVTGLPGCDRSLSGVPQDILGGSVHGLHRIHSSM
jgi:hypothetical protein